MMVSPDPPVVTRPERVLLTGATGCIGQALLRRLSAEGFPLTVLVRNRVLFAKTFADVELAYDTRIVEGDLGDRSALSAAADGVALVLHAAARVHSRPQNSGDIDRMRETNIEGTGNLLHALRDQSLRRFIFFSTIGVYGRSASGIKLDEFTPCCPDSEYGKSKLEAEKLIGDFFARTPLVPVIFRLAMVYGEGDRGNLLRLIRAVDRGRFIEIDGGRALKSMTYVENVVDAALLTIGREGAGGKTFVFSDSSPYTMHTVAETIARHLNRRVPPFSPPAWVVRSTAGAMEVAAAILRVRPFFTRSDVATLLSDTICDSSRIRTLLSFEPRIALEEGIGRTICWYRSAF